MKPKRLVQGLLSVLAILFLFGCAAKEPVGLPSFSAKQFSTDMYQSKVDNFSVVLDASSSMEDFYNGNPKFVLGKAIAERLNLTIPELGQTAGFRSFGHHDDVSKNLTELWYGMDTYSTQGFEAGIDKVTKPGGFSPMGRAIEGVTADLKDLPGVHNAVVIISDGLDMEETLAQVQALKDQFGSSVCFYPIQVGDSPEGKAFLQEVARIGNCGFLSSADDLIAGDNMAGFVEKAFLTKRAVKEPVKEMVRKDTDGDGVYDDEDQCPGTPMGAKVNAVGCWTLENVLFDFDKSEIKAEAYPLLDDVVAILKKNPAMNVELQGHTDNIGSKAYNMGLSMRRADAVKAYLAGKGIMTKRMTTKGYGFSKPVALNGTDFGRSLNRRVEIHPF